MSVKIAMKSSVLLAGVFAAFAASSENYMSLWGAADGLVRLEVTIDGEARNMIDNGQRLGHIIVKGTAGGGAGFTLDTRGDHGNTVGAAPWHRVRQWRNEAGLDMRETFTIDNGEAVWTVSLGNLSSVPIVVTDLGLRIPLGGMVYSMPGRKNLNRHVSICSYGSWIYWVRYDGIGECVVMMPDERTPLEYYTEDSWFYIHSSSIRDKDCPWRIPATKLELAPGEAKSYSIRFFTAKSHDDVPDAIYAHGGVNVRVAPSMTIPRGETARIAMRSKRPLGAVAAQFPSKTVVGAWRQASEGFAVAEAKFSRLGENRLGVAIGEGRSMYLDFFVTEDVETVVKKRAAFITKRQQHRNPEKWYNGLYSIFDVGLRRLLSPDDLGRVRVPYMVGGSDDPSNCKPLYISEKNVAYPDADEIAALEYYEKNFVWGKLQRTDKEYPYPCGIYGCDNWHKNRSGECGGFGSEGFGKERLWRTYDYPTHMATYFNLYRIASENPSMTHYLDADGYLNRSYLTAMAFFEVPYSIWTGRRWLSTPWLDWAYKLHHFHERYMLDLLDALERRGWQEKADRLRREWEKKVTYLIYEHPWPYGSELFVDRTAFETSFYLTEYALTRKMVPQEMFWYDKNKNRWYSYTSYPEERKRTVMHDQLIANLALRGLNGTTYENCGTAWTGCDCDLLDYMTQMGGVALLDYAVRFAPPERQCELVRHGYNALIASWALVNCGDAASGYGYWHKGAELDGAAGWCLQSYPKACPYKRFPGGVRDVMYVRGPWDIDGEIDHGFTGGVHGSGCYVVNDPVFGEIAYGARMEGDAAKWRVTPWDGVRRYLSFPQRGRFEMRLVNNGIAKGGAVEVLKDFSKISIPLERRSEAEMQEIEFRSLPKGEWTVRTNGGKDVKFTSSGGLVTVRFPFATSVEIVRNTVLAK